MNEHIEKMVNEFNLLFGGVSYPFVEGVGAKQSDCFHWVRAALTSAYNAGLEKAKEVAKREESCGELEELGTCGHYHANESHVIAAIEKEKLTDQA